MPNTSVDVLRSHVTFNFDRPTDRSIEDDSGGALGHLCSFNQNDLTVRHSQ